MSARSFAIGICLCVAVFLTDQESFAYENSTEIDYIVPSNNMVALSETLRESGDYDWLYCAIWIWDDYDNYCYLWVLEFNDPLVDAWSISPSGVSTFRGTDVDIVHAEVGYSFSPTADGIWTAEGSHYVQQAIFLNYCPFGLCTGWFFGGVNYPHLAETEAQHSRISLEIARYTSVSLTEFNVDSTILPSANELLQTNDGLGDVACPMSFRRSGSISTFTTGDGVINTEAELNAVFAVDGLVKVVEEIKWCGTTGTNIVGCAGPQGIAVTRVSALEGMLWAHEYGHNQGLWLTAHRTTSFWLGFSALDPNARRVSQSECDAMRNPN